jgi:hypothetical protein
VEENFLNETYYRFYQTTEISEQFRYEKTPNGDEDVVASLYRDAGRGKNININLTFKAIIPDDLDHFAIPPEILSVQKVSITSTSKFIFRSISTVLGFILARKSCTIITLMC